MNWPRWMNVDRFQSLFEEARLDAVVASSFRNVFYTSGALIETQRRIPLRLALTVLPRDGDPALIVGNIEESLARAETPIEDVRSYVEFEESPMEVLADVLKEKGLARRNIGIENRHLVVTYHEELLRCLPQVKLHAADDFFEEVRMIKSPAEIEVIRHACTVTEQAILDAYQGAKPGEREKDVALRIRTNVISQGADSIRFCVLGAGPLSAQFHRVPGEKRLLPGELVRVDCGAYFGAYASDVARAAVVQTVSPTIEDTYRRYMDIQRATIRQMKPGTRACDAFRYCSQAFERAGMAFHSPHIGHAIGVDGGHDEPMLHPKSRRVLEPNMMFCVEPVLVDPKVGAYQVEDLVLITDDEPEILTTIMDTSDIHVIK